MTVPDVVLDVLADLRGMLQDTMEPPVYVSDRRLVKAIALMKVPLGLHPARCPQSCTQVSNCAQCADACRNATQCAGHSCQHRLSRQGCSCGEDSARMGTDPGRGHAPQQTAPADCLPPACQGSSGGVRRARPAPEIAQHMQSSLAVQTAEDPVDIGRFAYNTSLNFPMFGSSCVVPMQVSAYTNGRREVSIEDCLLLQHLMWQKPKEADRIQEWLLAQLAAATELKQCQALLKSERRCWLLSLQPTASFVSIDSGCAT